MHIKQRPAYAQRANYQVRTSVLQRPTIKRLRFTRRKPTHSGTLSANIKELLTKGEASIKGRLRTTAANIKA